MEYVVQVEDRTFVIDVQKGTITIDGQNHAVDLRHIEPLSLYSLLIDNLSHEVFIEKRETQYAAMLRGKLYTVQVHDAHAMERDTPRTAKQVLGGELVVEAPMPGLVLEVHATPGQVKQAGDVLIILESMKMKTDIRCPQDGTIEAVHVAAQDHVTQGQRLVTVSSSQGDQPSIPSKF
jgi:biotin carboxyl carrier protein